MPLRAAGTSGSQVTNLSRQNSFSPFRLGFEALSPVFSRRRPRSGGDYHVGQSEECVELVRVFRQSAIPYFPVPKEILHDVKGMFGERARCGFGLFDRFLRLFLRAFGQRFDQAVLQAICQSMGRANATISGRFSTPV